MEIISRKDAIKQGLRYYFTGKECIHGHVSVRYSQSGTCVDCHDELKRTKEHVAYEKKRRSLTRVKKSIHEVKLFIICHPKIREVAKIAKRVDRPQWVVLRAMRELNIQQSKRPEHYVG